LKASGIIRSWPTEYLIGAMKELNDSGYDILLLDSPGNVQDFLQEKAVERNQLRMVESPEHLGLAVAMCEHCKLVIAPDSAWVYIAESLGVPVIALYSPFSSKLRLTGLNVYAIDVEGRDGKPSCYNCCTHTPAPCLRSKDGWSPCLKAIRPELVVALSQKILKGEV
jgi:ADP-heptose:LPS heptosyltransferase